MINDLDFSLFSLDFTYSDEEWDQIGTVVHDRLGLDADQIELQDNRFNEMQSLRGRFETAAGRHIWRSARESQTPGHKAGIKQLTLLRDTANAFSAALNDAILPSFTIGDMTYRLLLPDLGDVERAIATVESFIEAHITAQRPQPTANTRRIGRDRFWNEALAIWVSIGGEETGTAAAEFLIATSTPVFRRVRDIHGHKTAASTPLRLTSVVEWLRLRAKARQAATS